MENTKTIEFPDPKSDYHGHPDYSKVYLLLLVLFGASLVVGYFFSPTLAIAMIFITAVLKTGLVVNNFMHLKYEPYLLWIVIFLVVFIIGALLFGIMPDITMAPRAIAN